MRSYSWFLWSEITLYNTYYSYRIIQKCLWYISISVICIEESFISQSNITPHRTSLLLDHLFRFIAVHGAYMFFNYLFSPLMVKQLFPLCLEWRILLILSI